MPAGLDIPICLALSPHPKIKSFTKTTKGRDGGKCPFYLCSICGRKMTPTNINDCHKTTSFIAQLE